MPDRTPIVPTHPLVAATARNLLDLDPRTTSGIVATAQAHLSLFRDPILAANTAASDFSPLDLVDAERPVSERLDFQTDSSRPARRHPCSGLSLGCGGLSLKRALSGLSAVFGRWT